MINLLQLQLLTEKSIIDLEDNKYTFQVDINLSKIQIKKIFEAMFGLKVLKIRTCRPAKNFSNSSKIYKNCYKKVILTIEKDKTISLFSQSFV